MKAVYISGPYTATTREEENHNIRRAARAAALYYRKGYAVFMPHLQASYIDREFNCDCFFNYEDWLEIDICWLSKCDVVAFIPGWQESIGSKIEHMVARGLGKEIHYLEEHELEAMPWELPAC